MVIPNLIAFNREACHPLVQNYPGFSLSVGPRFVRGCAVLAPLQELLQ